MKNTSVRTSRQAIISLVLAAFALLCFSCTKPKKPQTASVLGFTMTAQANGDFKEQTTTTGDLTAAPAQDGEFPNSFRHIALKSGVKGVKFRYKVKWYSTKDKKEIESGWIQDGEAAPAPRADGHITGILIELVPKESIPANSYNLTYWVTPSAFKTKQSSPEVKASAGQWAEVPKGSDQSANWISRLRVVAVQ